MISAALGTAVMLTGCGGGSGTGGAGGGGDAGGNVPVAGPSEMPPNGFKFTELTNSATINLPAENLSAHRNAKAALRSASRAGVGFREFTGAVELTNGQEILFQAIDSNGLVALYQARVNFAGAIPALDEIHRVMGEGDFLPEGTVITGIGLPTGNSKGTLVTVLSQEEAPPVGYIGTAESGFEPIASMGASLPGGGGVLGGDVCRMNIDDRGNVAYVSSYVPDGSTMCKVGLIMNGEVSGVIFESPVVAPDVFGATGEIGLYAISENGEYVVQTTVQDGGTNSSGQTAKALPGTVVVHGKIGQPHTRSLIAASRSAVVNPLLRSSPRVADGAAIYGPRITRQGTPLTVLHLTPSHLAMFYDGRLVIQTGGTSPLGNTVASFTPPVSGGDARIYFVLICVETAELVMYDGTRMHTILTRGDKIGDRSIDGLNFGLMVHQADAQDRLVLIAEWSDNTSGIVVGVPV